MTDEKAPASGTTLPLLGTVGGSSIVMRLGDPVGPADVSSILQMRSEEERIERLRALLKEWDLQQKEERDLRRFYAKVLLGGLGFELALVFVAFFLIAARVLEADKWMTEGFLIGALAQTTSLVLVVTKYLFPDRSSDVLRLIEVATTGPATAPRKES